MPDSSFDHDFGQAPVLLMQRVPAAAMDGNVHKMNAPALSYSSSSASSSSSSSISSSDSSASSSSYSNPSVGSSTFSTLLTTSASSVSVEATHSPGMASSPNSCYSLRLEPFDRPVPPKTDAKSTLDRAAGGSVARGLRRSKCLPDLANLSEATYPQVVSPSVGVSARRRLLHRQQSSPSPSPGLVSTVILHNGLTLSRSLHEPLSTSERRAEEFSHRLHHLLRRASSKKRGGEAERSADPRQTSV
ncbi:hypothetical protein CAOG_02083 [Capsaspora owczarzaki ATCC 30864]|uniref:Uncharacterized protein n=1 Tax=Capsaspora owczarzaki (strain ATCC 30864) TaxID=595528 RepID=A0A0D2WKK9_CAPO3|nr:hypothetical protein CAOG_02083 [Capsaspora owczarzaki ATCC 30864]KJE90840.1 hypothetical protein CAOG_002083 [Capsaspora owczarzaki ATCC 30864]|eukprot:XP_004348833.1 hypothetical protein CAOG_02083 [Capsaspora owczarzaki ATCC 30864]